MGKNWLENNPEDRRFFAESMVETMRGLGYEPTFEQAWEIVADDELCDKYYGEADKRWLQHQWDQMIIGINAVLDEIRIKGQKNKYD